MPHVLAQVRSAAVTVLTGLPTTGAHVFEQEFYPWTEAQLPALVVATSADPVAESLDWPTDLRYEIVLQVTIIVRGLGNLAAAIDQITSEAQAALCALAAVGGKVVSVVPVNLSQPEFSGDGDQPVARRLMTFDVRTLYTTADDPDTLI